MFKKFAEPNAENVYMRFPVQDGRQEPKAAARRSAGRATEITTTKGPRWGAIVLLKQFEVFS